MRSLIKVAGEAVIGRSHERCGTPCQDKYYTWRSKDKKWAGIALSDGAGSSTYSQIAAEFAVNSIIPFVYEHFNYFYKNPSNAGKQIVEFLLNVLSKIAKENKLMLNDMACTLLFVLILRKKDFIHYLAGHIGDGTIFFERDKNVEVLSEPERGEYANTTIFLTSKNSESKLRIYSGILRRPAGFMIMSDGTAETLYIKRVKSPNQAYCQQIFNWCNRYSQKKIKKVLLMNLKNSIFREVSLDDCSLCLLKVT
ncbi:MAG: protein phosphatase 2C domain-containing protein [Desulfobacterales bacterium]|nr:protein phosphatase 2C domain-containing protein [Desulfobacterales bacterium]